MKSVANLSSFCQVLSHTQLSGIVHCVGNRLVVRTTLAPKGVVDCQAFRNEDWQMLFDVQQASDPDC